MSAKIVSLACSLILLLAAPAFAGPPSCTPPLVGPNVNGDAYADLIVQGGGTARVQTMSGTTVLATGYPPTGGGGFLLAATGDMDNDGKTDLAWQGKSGTGAAGVLRFNTMNGVSSSSTGWASDAGGQWQLFALADMDGDGKADAIYKGVSGGAVNSVKVVIMNGVTAGSSGLISTGGGTWDLVDVADLNGDGKSDLIFDGGTSGMRLNLMNGTASSSTGYVGTAGGAFVYQGSGDLDGDGTPDLVYRNSNTMRFDFMSGASVSSNGWASVATSWVLQGLTDLNGDCKADVIYASTSQLRMDTMNGATVTATGYAGLGGGAYSPVAVADLDGDGNSDILLDGPSDTRIMFMNGTATSSTGSIANGGGALKVYSGY